MYGEKLPDIKIYTDKVYSEVLVVNKNCVYKKGNSYYVRVLDENGYYIKEQEVKVSLETEEYMQHRRNQVPGIYRWLSYRSNSASSL